MAFVLDQSDTYKCKVEIEVPVGKKTETQDFYAEFKNISQSRLQEMMNKVATQEMLDVDVAKEILMGWEGLEMSDGSEVPFNKPNRDKLLDVRGVATAISYAFVESCKNKNIKNL